MGHKKGRSRKYDKIRDEKMKGHTKCNQNQPTKVNEEDEIHEEDGIHEEDEIHEDEQIGSFNDRNIQLGVGNLMDLDENLFFCQISSTEMVKENTI